MAVKTTKAGFKNEFFESYVEYWKNYVKFSGRATRMEFWVPVLLNWAIAMVLIMTVVLIPVAYLFQLATIVPGLAVLWRRSHDVGKPGWLTLVVGTIGFILMYGGFALTLIGGFMILLGILLSLAGLAGIVLYVIWMATPGGKKSNEYGAARI
ncbi:hypothetical protein FACS189421_14570 [Bacteroidia bacterium]|nr:hypothetical protein FACS189421_14570 [Bacteroidia bacterium]